MFEPVHSNPLGEFIDINNSNIYYTSTFNGGARQSGGTTTDSANEDLAEK